MAQTAAHLVDHVIPHVPVRQWVLVWVKRLPIPLRLLLAAHAKLVTPVLQVVHRVITRHLLGQTGLKADEADEADEADSGAVTLIQRFGSAANLNIHLHCLVLDGVYRCGADGAPVFAEVPAPTDEALHAVLHKIITRTMKLLTRLGVLIEEQGQTYMADNDGDSDEARARRPLQAAACYLPHRAWTTRRPEGADGARCHAEGDGLQSDAVRRHAGFQPARRRALWRRRSPSAGTTVPLHHPPSAGQRTGAVQRCWPSGAEAQDTLRDGTTHLGLRARAPPRAPARGPQLPAA